MGAWISYALGSLADNLPTFVVLPDARGLPYNQRACFSAVFFPRCTRGPSSTQPSQAATRARFVRGR
jgi:hypothetical protein